VEFGLYQRAYVLINCHHVCLRVYSDRMIDANRVHHRYNTVSNALIVFPRRELSIEPRSDCSTCSPLRKCNKTKPKYAPGQREFGSVNNSHLGKKIRESDSHSQAL